MRQGPGWGFLLSLLLAAQLAAPSPPAAAQDVDLCRIYTSEPTEANRRLCFEQMRAEIRLSLDQEGFNRQDPKEAAIFTLVPGYLSDCLDEHADRPPADQLEICRHKAVQKTLEQVYRLGGRDERLLGHDPLGDCLLSEWVMNPTLPWRAWLTACQQQRDAALKEVVAARVESPDPGARHVAVCAVALQAQYPTLSTDRALDACLDLLSAQDLEQRCLELLDVYTLAASEVCSTIASGAGPTPSSDPSITSVTTGTTPADQPPPDKPPPAPPTSAAFTMKGRIDQRFSWDCWGQTVVDGVGSLELKLEPHSRDPRYSWVHGSVSGRGEGGASGLNCPGRPGILVVAYTYAGELPNQVSFVDMQSDKLEFVVSVKVSYSETYERCAGPCPAPKRSQTDLGMDFKGTWNAAKTEANGTFGNAYLRGTWNAVR